MPILPLVGHFRVEHEWLGEHIVAAPHEPPSNGVAWRDLVSCDGATLVETIHIQF
jgi:hypothetical protein